MSDIVNYVELKNAGFPWWMRKAAQQLAHSLAGLKYGTLTLELPSGKSIVFSSKTTNEPRAHVKLHNLKPLQALLLHGELAFAESYLNCDWESENLQELFRLVMMNISSLSFHTSKSWLAFIIDKIRHRGNANSKSGSKRNIAYHYDLGNEFYEMWLDQSMTYSSALFEANSDEFEQLERAQYRKYQKVAELCEINDGQEILEIGCGWGGFSEFVAANFKSHIRGITLSKKQLEYAQNRYIREDMSPNALASLIDYRDVIGTYDRIVSIEMFEAVGQDNWDVYFQKIHDSLSENGVAALQIITIDHDRFAYYQKNVDFIQKYIFPGGMLPSIPVLKQHLARANLVLEAQFMFGDSYATTCKIWRERFLEKWPEIKALGFDDRFKNMWLYYLTYCQIGFEIGNIDVGIFKVRKNVN